MHTLYLALTTQVQVTKAFKPAEVVDSASASISGLLLRENDCLRTRERRIGTSIEDVDDDAATRPKLTVSLQIPFHFLLRVA